ISVNYVSAHRTISTQLLHTSFDAILQSSIIIYSQTAGSWAATGHKKICSAAHLYCSKFSFFQSNTGTPAGFSAVPLPTTTAAAASSWVEKILHDAHRTPSPNAETGSTRAAV